MIILVFLMVICGTLCNPSPPNGFPGSWYSWLVTAVVHIDKIVYWHGQYVIYDDGNKVSCRFAQQNFLETSNHNRPVDWCDYGNEKYHYSINDTTIRGRCSGMQPIDKALKPIVLPAEFVSNAKHGGVIIVNNIECNHFFAHHLQVNGHLMHIDTYAGVDDNIPRQISMHDLQSQLTTTWAFDQFTTKIPTDKISQCHAARLLCKHPDWICKAKQSNNDNLGKQLRIACDPEKLDCSPINPGGDHFEPNTVYEHCNWAFNAYYLMNRGKMGINACSFGEYSDLVSPASSLITNTTILHKNTQTTQFINSPLFPLDLVC